MFTPKVLEEFEDTKGIIRSRKSKTDRQYNGLQKRDRQYNGLQKRDRQYNGQKKKKDKRTNINLQNTAQKTKDRTTRTSRKGGANSCSPEG